MMAILAKKKNFRHFLPEWWVLDGEQIVDMSTNRAPSGTHQKGQKMDF
jgi:hypothetical protein